MQEAKLKKLLIQGEQAAGQGDWQVSMDHYRQVLNLDPKNVTAVNGLATSLLQLGQVTEAVEYFEQGIALVPDSADAYNNLGVASMVAGQFERAEQAYQEAVSLNPDHLQAWKNLAIIYLKQNKMGEGVQILATLVKAFPKDIEALYLLGQCYQEAEEYDSARHLYNEALKIDPNFALVKEAMANMPPEVVDPTRIARSEHSKKLSALKSLKNEKPQDGEPSLSILQGDKGNGAKGSDGLFSSYRSVAFYGIPELPGGQRVELIAKLLAQNGLKTLFARQLETYDFAQYECVVFSQPHISSELINGVMACIQSGKPYALDIDQDYHNFPEDHPAYQQFGQGNEKAIQALDIMLKEAAWVSVPSQVLAERLEKFTNKCVVLPPMWDQSNALWEKEKPQKAQFNLGWLGTAADRPDMLEIKPVLVECLKAVPHAQLVIAGDPMLYDMFDEIAETRRLFLPAASSEDIPFVLSHFDALLLPLRDNLYNQAKSDLPLLEAGVLRIPWIASPIPSFQEWKAGGLFAESQEDWCQILDRLVSNKKLKLELGAKGRTKAEARARDYQKLII